MAFAPGSRAIQAVFASWTPTLLVARFRELLLGMSYDDPETRPLMDLEGLKKWVPGRTSGYAQLEEACDRFGWLEPFLERMGAA